MTPQQNAAAVLQLEKQVQGHPLCRRFEKSAGMYRVIYPAGYCVDGAQARLAEHGTKRAALERLHAAMERHWQESRL